MPLNWSLFEYSYRKILIGCQICMELLVISSDLTCRGLTYIDGSDALGMDSIEKASIVNLLLSFTEIISWKNVAVKNGRCV